MLVGTHALMPVSVCLVADHLSVRAGRGRFFPPWSLWVVGIFGILPDICSPHMSLEDRQTSWSHTVWFMAGLIGVVALTGVLFEKGHRFRVALACWVAAALHLLADGISGGIVPLYPMSDQVFGRYYIPAPDWIYYDAFFILLAWVLIRVIPHMEARQIRGESMNADLPDA